MYLLKGRSKKFLPLLFGVMKQTHQKGWDEKYSDHHQAEKYLALPPQMKYSYDYSKKD